MEHVNNLSKGSIPVSYIVALIFAIIVIAVIAYMFFTHTGIFSGVVSKEYCETQKLKYCYDWQKAGINFPPEWDEKCTGIGVAAPTGPDCKALGIEIV